MNGGSDSWKDIEEVLRRQIRLMEEFAELQLDLRKCLEARNWAQLELVQAQLYERTEELELVENERVQLWEECCKCVHANPADSFYAITLRLPEDQRARLAELRQSLRISTLNVQGAQRALNSYLEAATNMIQDYLRDVCSDLKAGVYGPQGKLKSASRFSMVLDTHR